MARHLEAFRRILGKENVLITGLEAYNTDFLRTIRGVTKTVLRPKDALETSKVLKYCSQWGIPVVPQGGNTGLSGGNIVQDENEVILSTARMTTELKIDTALPAVLTSAGNVLEVVTEACNKQGFTFPLDLGAKGSCQIGGNIATNAGGLRYLRYGSLHQNVLGLEIVLASGEILTDLDSMRKHNTGWDLKQIFIGSEGTLGVITRAAVLLYPLASSIQVCLFGCPSLSQALVTPSPPLTPTTSLSKPAEVRKPMIEKS
jgi:FAD/FMN-containing dehydrogenase